MIKKTKHLLLIYLDKIFFCLNHLVIYYYKLFFARRLFTFQNKNYQYFYHPYQHTWSTERSIEIPLVMGYLRNFSGKKILELGNVLSHYFKVNHRIIDKYEKANGVINQDIVDYQDNEKYDLIISISTLEHIGWDEEKKDFVKTLIAVNRLKKLLAEKGRIVLTLPIGYNPNLDKLIKSKKINFTKTYYLKRISPQNDWKQVNWQAIKNLQYGKPYSYANGIIIGVITR